MPSYPVPDLLAPDARMRMDAEATRTALTLAFAGGTAGGLFSEALATAKLPASSFDPGAFAEDLFMQRFVRQCFCIATESAAPVPPTSHSFRILTHPPSDPAVIEFRRAIARELDGNRELRRAFENLYLDLYRLRNLLENGGAPSWDSGRQKLDTLAALKQVFDTLSGGFAPARSGLQRLHEFGAAVVASEPYRSLVDLLRYDARLATLDLRIDVGADGRINGFYLLSVSENEKNPFVNPFWRRWLAKLELFVRGYHFSDAEVMARLIDSVWSGLDQQVVTLIQLFGDIEFYLGGLGFCDQARAKGLGTCLPELVAPGESRELTGLFNPLLLMSGITPVPCDLRIDGRICTTLVTGPNSGGKTRLLQAIGIAQLLAQSGLFIPARSGRLSPVSRLLVSLIQEVKADQTEGRLGTELLRIRALFESLPPGAMVLLDELCSGTNPSEGERIFELVITMLHKLRPQAFITTHFLTFAQRLAESGTVPGLGFLQVELDPQRRPTYQFVPGVAHTSLAEHTAERLGVTGEQLLELIEHNLRAASKNDSSPE